MTTEADFDTIKKLYDAVADEGSASYSVFRKKLKRLTSKNKRTSNRVRRSLGMPIPTESPVREFVAYDGEGEGDRYFLLANSLGEYIVDRENGLSTLACLDFMTKKYEKPVKRVFFAFGYDINFIIKDLNRAQLEALLNGRMVKYEGYWLHWIPGKIFFVNNIAYYDVFTFFTTSFINAIYAHLGDDAVSKTLIEGKAARGSFDKWPLEDIIEYNAEELKLLVRLMEKLRADFKTVGVNLQEWYGPGAVAKYWFKEHGIEPKEKHTVGSIKALNSAYYGGRFEQIVLGRVENPYEYDLHSAYPAVMADLPYFTSWKRSTSKEILDEEYSIWHITFDLREHYKQRMTGKLKPHNFCPLPVRARSGNLAFPMVGKGWYWYPEIKVLLDYFPEAKIIVHGGYIASTEGKPFTWVRDLYYERLRLKREGNPAQFAVKVGLNSLYGKCAQRVGKAEFFSLSWAGYITAKTRATIARAGYESGPGTVLGFATDAIFTTKPCKLQLSDDLGAWEEQRFKYGIFFQSGIYRMVDTNDKVSDRYRGSPLRHGIDDIIKQITLRPHDRPRVRIGRFVSNALAMLAPKTYGPVRLQFVQVMHEVKLDSTIKRFYNFEWVDKKTDNGLQPVLNFGDLLTKTINSGPKVTVNDDHWVKTWDLLWAERQLNNIESSPPPMNDNGTTRLLEEAQMHSVESGFDSVSSLNDLIVVEDTL